MKEFERETYRIERAPLAATGSGSFAFTTGFSGVDCAELSRESDREIGRPLDDVNPMTILVFACGGGEGERESSE